MWKAGIALAGLLLFLVLMVWVPVSASAHGGISGLTSPGAVQATPTVDVTATITALNEEKLRQEIQQLKNQNEPDLLGWFRMNTAILLSTLVVVIGGLIGLFRWFGDRRSEREKRAEERFQAAVTGLGNEKVEAKIGAAILLRTFLRSGYEQFYTQTFDLAVANLRIPRTIPIPEEDPDGMPHSSEDPNGPLPLTTLRQVLVAVYKEAFPLARSQYLSKKRSQPKSPTKTKQSLDATGIHLDNAFFMMADLQKSWMPKASLQKADLTLTNLSDAMLSEANFSGANLRWADFSGSSLVKARFIDADLRDANLSGANLSDADLNGANLSDADLRSADLRGANLTGTDLSDANLSSADLRGADLNGGKLSGVKLIGAKLNKAKLSKANLTGTDLRGANLSDADLRGARLRGAQLTLANLQGALFRGFFLVDDTNLKNTNLQGVKGLTKEQLDYCKAKGAIIDKDYSSSSSQSTISPPPPSQSNAAQTPSPPPTQANTPPPSTDGSSSASPQPSAEP